MSPGPFIPEVTPHGKPSIEQAKASLLAEDLDLSAGAVAGSWAKKNAVFLTVGAGLTGLVLARSRTLRRVAMAALLAPAVRREVMHRAAGLVRAMLERR